MFDTRTVTTPTAKPAIGPNTYPEQIIRYVQGCIFGIAAKGTLSTADIVPSIANKAISLELTTDASNSKKKARQITIARTAVNTAQLNIEFSSGVSIDGTIKAAIAMNSIITAKILFLLIISVAAFH